MRDAAVFPLYASGGLFGLYLFLKVCSISMDHVRTVHSCLVEGCEDLHETSICVLPSAVYAQRVCEPDLERVVLWSGCQCTHQSFQVSPPPSLIPVIRTVSNEKLDDVVGTRLSSLMEMSSSTSSSLSLAVPWWTPSSLHSSHQD